MDADKDFIIEEGLRDWAAYFRKKQPPRVEKMYADVFFPYSVKTIRYIFKEHLKYGEKFLFLHELSTKLSRVEDLPADYDKTEDQRFPVGKMWEAFYILKKDGEAYFNNFCRVTGMPKNDKERVVQKYKMAYNINFELKGIK